MNTIYNHTILITASGLVPVGINTVLSLKAFVKKVIGVDINKKNVASYFCDKFYKVPLAKNPRYIANIVKICKKEKVDAIFPLTIEETIPLLKNKKRFASLGIKIVNANSLKTIEICNDKFLTLQFLQNKKIKVLKAYPLSVPTEVIKFAKELGYPRNKVVLKPRITHGGRGFRIISAKTNYFDLLINNKIEKNFYIPLDNLMEIIKNKIHLNNLMLTEYLEGDDYSVYCLCDKGNTIIVFPTKRDGLANRASNNAELVWTPKIINYVKKIIRSFSFSGFTNIQLIDTKHGPKIYEINPRIAATTAIALGTGLNFPLLNLLYCLDKKEEMKKIISKINVKWGIKMYRIQREIFYDQEKFYEAF